MKGGNIRGMCTHNSNITDPIKPKTNHINPTITLQFIFIIIYLKTIQYLNTTHIFHTNKGLLCCAELVLVILLIQMILQIYIVWNQSKRTICNKEIFQTILFLVNYLSAGLISIICLYLRRICGPEVSIDINPALNKFILSSILVLSFAIIQLFSLSVQLLKGGKHYELNTRDEGNVGRN